VQFNRFPRNLLTLPGRELMINASDYPCLQAALDASLNVLIPAGVYVDQPLTFRPGHRVRGEGRGTVLKATGAVSGAFLNSPNADNVELSNLAIDIDPMCTSLVGLQVQNSTGSRFSNIVFTNSGQSFGVYSQDCTDCIFDYIEMSSAKVRCIHHENGVRTKTRYHKLSSPGVDHCIQIHKGSNNDVQFGYVEKAPAFGISYYETSGGDCSGNKAYNTKAEAYQITNGGNIRIHDNDAAWDLGRSVDFGISISGETVYPPNVAPVRSYANLNKVYNNMIDGCGKSGIAIAGNAAQNHIHNNLITNPCNLGEVFTAGIVLYGTYCTSNYIESNVIGYYAAPSKMRYGIAEWNYERGYASSNRMGCNKVAGAATSILLLGSGSREYMNY
jgi:hypothetical protein